MISTEPAVETWHTCRRESTCSASSTSRAMIASSATAGQPVRPSSEETSPSCICAPSVRRGSRSEERRVGKECRSRWARYHQKKKEGMGHDSRSTYVKKKKEIDTDEKEG